MSLLTLKSGYGLVSRIGGGSFGEIFLATQKSTGRDVAAKVETSSNQETKSQLRREAKIYLKLSGQVGISKVLWFGSNHNRSVLIMELLGRSLEDLFSYCGRRDIKPENFLMGRGRSRHTVYVIDFGLAKYYRSASGTHIPLSEGYSLTGTARYASINAHDGLEQSRRDDLYSIGYVLLYFLRGSLPWQGLQCSAGEDKYQLILDKKRSTSTEELCSKDLGVPDEFRAYFAHLDVLQFEDRPDYAYLKGLFRDLFARRRFTHDSVLFDWEVLAYQRQQQQQS